MKIRKLFIFSILLFIVATISNCTVQKRSYRNGYYVSWNKKASPLLKIAKHVEAKKAESKNVSSEILNIQSSDTQGPLYASAQKINKREIIKMPIKPIKLINDNCGDVISLKNGKEIIGRIFLVNSKTISYKPCSNLNGPLLEINPEDVFRIKYTNRSNVVFGESLVKKKELEIVSDSLKQSNEPDFLTNTCGDIITLRDGTDIEARVIEIGSKAIKYKRCNNIEGPTIVVNIETVFMIKYANGTKEIFKKEDEKEEKPTGNYQSTQQKPLDVRKNNVAALISFICLCLFFFYITLPVSFVLGLVALSQFKKQPDKYKNKWMAQVPVILGCIALGIILLMLIFVLISM